MNINTLNIQTPFKSSTSFSIIFLLSLFLSACNNSDNSSKPTIPIQEKIQVYSKQTILKGKVSSEDKTFTSGSILVTDVKGKTVATTQLGKGNHYSVTIPSGTGLPIILSFSPEGNDNKKDKLIAVALYPAIKVYDINDTSTAIASTAKARGGYTHKNMVFAADNLVGVPDANKTSTGFRGDPTKQYGGWH
jgi:hypothetical protein